jgi:hypothetical protein
MSIWTLLERALLKPDEEHKLRELSEMLIKELKTLTTATTALGQNTQDSSTKVERLTTRLFWLTVVLGLLTAALVGLAAVQG